MGALLTAGLGFAIHYFPFGQGVIHASYDALLVSQGERVANEAVIIYLDERSHQELDQPLNAPWDRNLHALLVDKLAAAGARCIAFDVVFSDPAINGQAADENLARAIKSSGRVILAADRVRFRDGEAKTLPPIALLRDSAADRKGSAEVVPSPDLVVREHTTEEELPALSWVAAEFAGARATTNEQVRVQHRWINYYGPPGMIKGMSYVDALKAGPELAKFCQGKVVFVGAYTLTKFAGDRKDEFRNPFGFFRRGTQMFMPGVEIQATMCLNLLREDWLHRWSDWLERAVIIVLGLVTGFALMRLPPLRASTVGALALAVLWAVCWAVIKFHLFWFAFFIVAIQIGFALLASVVYNSLQTYVQKRLTEQILKLYLPPSLVKKFAVDPTLLRPGAKKQVVTLFFSDVEDFTKQSEGLDSDELAHVMNEYFEVAVIRGVHATEGTVVKYIGDCIFAFWNAPDPQPDHHLRACHAMLHFRDNVPKEIRGLKLHTRIGLHTGVANVGNFGSVERVDYTALGENVNLASRLEGLNKHLGTSYLLSGATLAGVGDQLVTRAVGRFRLKGFEAAVEVHELVGWPAEAETSRAWRAVFAAALAAFQRADFNSAIEGFQRTLELHPGDGPSNFYLDRITELSAQPLPAGWKGEVQLKEK